MNLLLMPTGHALGLAIRARRREQALRIDDAAALCGVSVDLLSRLENGKGSVRMDKALAVLDGLGLAVVVGPKEHPWMQTAAHGRMTAGDEKALPERGRKAAR